MTINIVSFSFLLRYLPGKLKIGKIFIKPFLASVLSVTASKIIYGNLCARYSDGAIVTLLSIALAAIIYLTVCLAFKVIDIKEIKRSAKKPI